MKIMERNCLLFGANNLKINRSLIKVIIAYNWEVLILGELLRNGKSSMYRGKSSKPAGVEQSLKCNELALMQVLGKTQ